MCLSGACQVRNDVDYIQIAVQGLIYTIVIVLNMILCIHIIV